MKRPRPYIPLEVRCRVVARQVGMEDRYVEIARADPDRGDGSYANLLRTWVLDHMPRILGIAGGDYASILSQIQLDHSPALALRDYNPRIKDVAARYTPNANDPTFLVYRVTHDHHIKTNVRGDGAQRSDTAERVHRRRVEKNRARREAVQAGRLKKRRAKSTRRARKFAWPKRAMRSGRKLRRRNP